VSVHVLAFVPIRDTRKKMSGLKSVSSPDLRLQRRSGGVSGSHGS
jgi:hypothetical protein